MDISVAENSVMPHSTLERKFKWGVNFSQIKILLIRKKLVSQNYILFWNLLHSTKYIISRKGLFNGLTYNFVLYIRAFLNWFSVLIRLIDSVHMRTRHNIQGDLPLLLLRSIRLTSPWLKSRTCKRYWVFYQLDHHFIQQFLISN